MLAALSLLASACLHRPIENPNVIVVGVTSGPNNLDPRIGTDDVSQKIGQLVFNNLMTLDEHLRVVPDLAERLDHPDPTTWVVALRHGVRFHDGHELTAADVVFTFRSLLDPALLSPRKGAYRMVQTIDARDRYTVVFTLKEPFGSFPVNLVFPIVPDGAGPSFHERPIGTGPYRFVRYAVDDRVELEPFADYFGGRPANDGLVLRVVPDDIMRGLELRKGTMDVVVNDLAPDILYQLGQDPRLQLVQSPGTDFQYIGVNLRDPILNDVRVRQAIAYAIDRNAIITYLRRGLAIPATGLLPPVSWAFDPDVTTFQYDPATVVRHPAEPACGRDRARCSDVRVRDVLRRRPEGQLSALHAAVGRGRRRGPRHPSARVSLRAGSTARIQSRLLPGPVRGSRARQGGRIGGR
ncbi:MAG: ABC transporter substrate-binding protein [Acidobacteria bacterium]|nr:ABC transporter substrate-binding protein [Acidobacteriota bacterium]